MFKGFLSEGGIRAPMIIAGKGVAGSGRISEAVAHVMDIPATILDAAGVRIPRRIEGKPVAPLQGKSLAPVLGNVTRCRAWPGRLDRLGAVRQPRHPAG